MELEKAEKIAQEIMKEWGVLNWEFGWDHARKRFGCCNLGKKKISLSKKLTELNDAKTVREVIIHEVAHALCKPKDGHGKNWKEQVKKMGGMPERCFSGEVKMPKMKWTAKCPACLKTWQASRKGKGACKECCKKFAKGKFDKRFEIVWEENGKAKKQDGLLRLG